MKRDLLRSKNIAMISGNFVDSSNKERHCVAHLLARPPRRGALPRGGRGRGQAHRAAAVRPRRHAECPGARQRRPPA